MGLNRLDIVTIDGPAGSGKSTVARRVASQIGFTFLDTGAMYRAVALGAIEQGITVTDGPILQEYLDRLDLQIRSESELMRLAVNGMDVTEAIRRPEMGQHASDFSRLQIVRDYCTMLQRRFGESGRIVCEGRDMGTVVFPDARWKYFMTAALEERTKRRWLELLNKGEALDFDTVRKSLETRDFQDTNREIAPLRPAADAILLDTTDRSISEVVDVIIRDIKGSASLKSHSLLHNC